MQRVHSHMLIAMHNPSGSFTDHVCNKPTIHIGQSSKCAAAQLLVVIQDHNDSVTEEASMLMAILCKL